MLKILSIILIINFIFAKEIPLSLSSEVSNETAASVLHPLKIEEMGYNLAAKKITDAVIDDSGEVHILIDGQYERHGHIWLYLRYDKDGNRLFKKEIYSGNYLTNLHNFLVSRVLINPDMTALVFYPDSEYYTCWVKLDQSGNIIERNETSGWRGDANFRVCSAGQDSFHIVTFPLGFWNKLIKQHHPDIGEYYLEVKPSIVPELYYSNNFTLKGKRIHIRRPFSNLNVPRIIPLPDKKIFCFFNHGKYGRSWIMDSNGKCYDAEVVVKDNLDEICFAKVKVDTIVERLPIDMSMHTLEHIVDWSNLDLVLDNKVCISVFWKGALYLVKYDLDGKIIQKGKGIGKLVRIDEMDKARVSPFVTQMAKTTFYWGFDDLGNFFLQIY